MPHFKLKSWRMPEVNNQKASLEFMDQRILDDAILRSDLQQSCSPDK